MPLEKVTVIAGGSTLGSGYGREYDEWETVVIENDAQVGYVNALLTTTEVTPIGANTQSAFDKWAFPPGTPIEIYANGDMVCNTIVWQYVPTADASQHNITLYCKSQSFNLSVSSIVSEAGGSYENQSVRQIIGDWAQRSGVRVLQFGDDPVIPFWQIRQGGTGYEEALRMIKSRKKLLFGMMDGSIAISDGQAMGAQGPVVQGENILRMTGRLTDMQFDFNTTLGQQNIGTDLKNDIQAHGEANTNTPGSALSRRFKTIIEPAFIDNQAALERSDWERRRAFGATTEAIVVVPGWHAPTGVSYVTSTGQQTPPSGGPLWQLMADTYIYAPWLKINCVLRAVRVVFKQSQGEGSTTELTLQDPVAFAGMSGAPCDNGAMWNPGFNPLGQYMPGFEDEIWDRMMRYFGNQGGGIGHM